MATIDFATLVRAKWGDEYDQPDEAYQFTGRVFQDTGYRGGIYVISTATLMQDRKMNAGNLGIAQEGYAITAPAANVHKGKAIAAALGAFALTGINTAIRKGKAIAAAERAIAITGIAANLSLNLRRVPAAKGSYAITGMDVTITKALESKGKLTAEVGSFTVTPTDIFMTK